MRLSDKQMKALRLAFEKGYVSLPYQDRRTEESLHRRGLIEWVGFDRWGYSLSDAGEELMHNVKD